MKKLLFPIVALAAVFGNAGVLSREVSIRNSVGLPVLTPVELTLRSSSGDSLVVTLFPNSKGSIELPAALAAPGTLSLNKLIQVTSQDRPPLEITIRVTAKRRTLQKSATSSATNERSKEQIQKFVNTSTGDIKNLTKGQSGVAEDSAGQQHVRGEHAGLTFVVDGVPLPDSLSGRQGSVVIPSTIDRFEILTGAYAPEFGGQTAAILNIGTTPGTSKTVKDLNLSLGSFQSKTGDLTVSGPMGKRGSFAFNVASSQTNIGQEGLQPDNQDVHNKSWSDNMFAKFRQRLSSRDVLHLTMSRSPDRLDVPNRTGLPSRFASTGQGYGFGGLRNADGTRPDVSGENDGSLGSQTIKLQSQASEGMDIFQHEMSEFATMNWQHQFRAKTQGQLAVTLLHSGIDVGNRNPSLDVLNLPVDSSIEYNPEVSRNVHHVQISSSVQGRSTKDTWKAGFLLDFQSGKESYMLTPASQLALNALAALAPALVPAGSASETEVDVNGNPIYTPTSGTIPTLNVSRRGVYHAAFAQNTSERGRLTANYGVRWDHYLMNQDLGQEPVNSSLLSPRLNFAYKAGRKDQLRWSYNRLLNTPPLAQGAILGAAIVPEKIDQYDASWEHKIDRHQTLTLAYYYKDIRNQVDTGLLIPGSQIGVYSAVSLEKGGVHGVELSYDIAGLRGWDTYLNWSHSAAKPNGLDNTGEETDTFNDHDQRDTIGLGLAYGFRNGATAAFTLNYGSGLASSVIDASGKRIPRTDCDLRLSSGDKVFGGRGSVSLDIQNLFDTREVINYQSAFSGTRFVMPRRIGITASFRF